MAFNLQWEVLDGEGTPIGRIAAESGSVVFDSRARIKRVCRGVRFDPVAWADVNPFSDWFSPVVTGADGVPRRMGVFTATSVPLRWLDSDVLAPVEPFLVDAGWYLYQPSVEPLGAFLGDRLSKVLERVARDAGVTRLVNQACGERCGQAMVQPPGTSPGEFMEGVALLAGFAPPWFDRDGVLQLGPYPEVTDGPDVVYRTQDVIQFSRITNQNLLEAPNVFVVRASDATLGSIVGEAEVPSSAPHSVANRGGRRVVSVINEQGLLSTAQANRVARSLAQASATSYETVEFQTLANTLHDGFTLVEYQGVLYREASWMLDFGFDGRWTMSHQLERAEVEGGA